MELFFATASLLAVTMVASFIYYRRIRQAREEYEGSRDLVRGITSGFTQQLNRVLSVIGSLAQDASYAKKDAAEALIASRDAVEMARSGEQNTESLAQRLEETDMAIASLKEDMQKIAERPVAAPRQARVDAPIPLKQDAVLDTLTYTELEVLTLIEELGEGSVPEIRERIGKTREHTARLLKKLYENGFVDRNTSGMPYRYYVRKEIKELIQQQKEKVKLAI